MSRKDWFFILLLSVIWGGSFFFNRIALDGLPVFTIVFFRVAAGSGLLWLFSILTRKKIPKTWIIWLSFLIMGLLNNVIPFSMIVRGQQNISSGFASILNAMTPFFTVITTHLFTKDEKMNVKKIAGVSIGLIGVVVLIGFEAVSSGQNHLSGIFMVLSATISYSFAGVWGRRFGKWGVDPVVVAAGQLSGSAVILAPVSAAVDHFWTLPFPGADVILAVAGLAVLSSAIAYIIYFRILFSSGAVNAVLVTFLIPVSAVLLGVLILSEDFHLHYLAGMAVISAGLLVLDGRIFNAVSGLTKKAGS